LRNVFTYKNFSLSTLIDLRQGFDLYNATRGSMNQNGTTKETEDRYTPTVFPGIKRSDGSINDISVMKGRYWYTGAGGGFGSGIHSEFSEDGSWIRLREVTLGYQVPSTWLNKIYMSNASISLFGRNLLLLTEYSGGDPETNLNGDNNSGGYDYFTIP